MRALFSSLAFMAGLTCAAHANDSTYTKLDLDKDCTFYDSNEQGGSAKCKGYKQYPVYFAEGDLRQTVRFGHADPDAGFWESFSEFNHINDTIEWRLANDGNPFATILRWFIETDGATGNNRGQVLVVSTVAGDHNNASCIVGYIDARANKNANLLAREVADTMANGFKCGVDLPRFHGTRSQSAGNPTTIAD